MVYLRRGFARLTVPWHPTWRTASAQHFHGAVGLRSLSNSTTENAQGTPRRLYSPMAERVSGPSVQRLNWRWGKNKKHSHNFAADPAEMYATTTTFHLVAASLFRHGNAAIRTRLCSENLVYAFD